jgi:hypothetical protein
MACRPGSHIEQYSHGQVLRCLDEANTTTATTPPQSSYAAERAPSTSSLATAVNGGLAAQPIELQCTSFDYSGWSNNAAMFTRRWWLAVLTPAASLTDDGNGMFEVRNMPSEEEMHLACACT